MRVVLTGTYSSANKGDAAMELAMIDALREAVPEVEVVVSSPFPELDESTYTPTRVVRCNRRSVVGFLQIGAALLAALLRRQPSWLLRGDELSTMSSSNVVVDLSGDMLTEDYGILVAVSHYLPILQARLLGVPYVICAQSLGPFRWTRPLAHWLLRGAAAVTVRESISLERLRHVRPDIEKTADMAYLLKPDERRLPDALLDTHDPTPVLGVSLSALVAGKHEDSGGRSFEDEVVAALEGVLADHPHQVRMVAHVTGPSEEKDDRVIARRVAARLGQRARVIEADLHPAAIKSLIANCDVFIGARMHANIAALTAGVPVVALGYSHKTEGIMAEFGQADAVLPAAHLRGEELCDLVNRVMEERAARRSEILGRLPALISAAQRNVSIVSELLYEADCDR